jgi:hypothetical protein
MMAVAVRLPETPSTPSEQLVALMESQMSPVASGMASQGLKGMNDFTPGNQMVVVVMPQITTAAPSAMTRSNTASWYSLNPPRRSSR